MKTKRQKNEKVKTDLNPFIVGMPVWGDDFFGREDIVNSVIRFISSPNQYNYLIFGQRRIGKTSLLRKLEKEICPANDVLAVYFNLQDKANTPLHLLLHELAKHIVAALDINIDLPQEMFVRERASVFMQSVFWTELIKKLPADRPLVLLFDEFDVIGEAENIKDEKVVGVRSYEQFIPFLTRLLEHISDNDFNIKFIFAIGRNYKDLNPDRYGQITKFNEQIELKYFDKATVLALLQKTADTIPFTAESSDRIFELTSGQPYFTQALAGKTFEHAQGLKVENITVDMVNKCMPTAVKSYAGGVLWIWDTLRPADQVILYLMALSAENETHVTKNNIKEKAVNMLMEPATRELDEIIARLLNINFIRKNNNGYLFAATFFREWIASEINEEDIKIQFNDNKEVDFNLTNARYYFDEKEYKKCLPFAEDILKARPSHFEALSLVARTYKFLGNLDKAYGFYKSAYAVNPALVEDEYVEILKNLLEERKKDGKDIDDIENELYKVDKTNVSDLYIIKQIEKQIYFKLEKHDGKVHEHLGYILDNNKVTGLGLFGANLKNISVLKELRNLDSLDLAGNNIQDISPLKELKNLKQLILSTNKILDISSLKELKNLNWLVLSSNEIEDISPLKKLKNLKTLDLSSNNIHDVSALEKLKNLNALYIASNEIHDISPLKKLKNLNILDLAHNHIQDISSLEELKNLDSLDLASNDIQDMSPLKELKCVIDPKLEN